MRRPRLSAKIVKGLEQFIPFIDAEICAGEEGYLEDASPAEIEAAEAALDYLRTLCRWHEEKTYGIHPDAFKY